MLEQEMASIIRFVLDSIGEASPYYWKMPENFCVPSVYFPTPEVVTGADMLATYSMEYAWYIMCFSSSDQAAYVMAFTAAEAVRKVRNLIPLIDETGGRVRGKYVRVNDPKCRLLDNGACQLELEFVSRRYYPRQEAEKMQVFEADIDLKEVESRLGQEG